MRFRTDLERVLRYLFKLFVKEYWLCEPWNRTQWDKRLHSACSVWRREGFLYPRIEFRAIQTWIDVGVAATDESCHHIWRGTVTKGWGRGSFYVPDIPIRLNSPGSGNLLPIGTPIPLHWTCNVLQTYPVFFPFKIINELINTWQPRMQISLKLLALNPKQLENTKKLLIN